MPIAMRQPSRSRRLRRYSPVATVTAGILLTTSGAAGRRTSRPAGTDTLAPAVLGTPNSFKLTDLSDGQAAYVWSSVYDTLLYTDKKLQIQPNAAESWSYTDGGQTLTLKLRTGQRFMLRRRRRLRA